MRLKALHEHPEAFGASYEDEINTPIDKLSSRFKNDFIVPLEENFMMGAFNENGDMIGIVGFRREKMLKLRHKASVWGMYVTPESRKTGVGRQLMSQLLNKAQSLEGLEQINLAVVSSNIKAKGLYSSFGFKLYGTEKNALKYEEQYFDDDFMVLWLK